MRNEQHGWSRQHQTQTPVWVQVQLSWAEGCSQGPLGSWHQAAQQTLFQLTFGRAISWGRKFSARVVKAAMVNRNSRGR